MGNGKSLTAEWSPLSHPSPPVEPIFHDANELLVAELVVVVHVEDLEDGVYQVT